MSIAKHIVNTIFWVLYAYVSNGQNKTIDSLKLVLQTQKEDTNRVNTLNQLSLAFVYGGQYNEAMEAADKAIHLSNKTGFKKGEGVAYDNKTLINYNQGNYPVALDNAEVAIKLFHESGSQLKEADELVMASDICRQQYNIKKSYQYNTQALKIYEAIGNKKGIAKIYTNIGDLQRLEENFSEALKNFLTALKIEEEIGNKKGIAHASVNIAYTYFDIGSYQEALKYQQSGFAIYTEIKSETYAAMTNKNIGDCYLKLGNYPEALNRCTAALNVLMKWGDQSWVAAAYTSIGTIYEAMGAKELQTGNHEQSKKNFEVALNYYLLGLKINEKTKFNIDESQYNLGSIYTRLNRLAEAKNSFEISLEIAKETNFKREIKNIYLGLSKIDSIEGNYRLAYEHYQKYNVYRDSLGDENNSRSVVELKLLYDFEKRDAIAKTEQIRKDADAKRTRNLQYTTTGFFLLIALFLFWNNRQKQKSKIKIEKAYSDLKATQAQLIQSEKMASLGELTAGIAHEIQNPLNFVNNFSEVNRELIEELASEIAKPIPERNSESETDLLGDIKQNLEKINLHGKRADSIVKGMMQHSQASSGHKEQVDVNELIDEYLRLAYHGLRAKDKSFNATLQTNYDNSVGKIAVIPQDIGRVMLNLINNAFYAVNEREKLNSSPFDPTVTVTTKKIGNKIEIKVSDNGNGIPKNIIDKIFQPFFTTKPTGQGTGLGLSLAYDIVTKGHGGELKVITTEMEGSEFFVMLPV